MLLVFSFIRISTWYRHAYIFYFVALLLLFAVIFFGVTAAIFEALETGVEVIHICSDPIFDSHSPDIWPNLEVKQLSSNVFHYNLKEIGKYIIFGEEKNTLNEVLKKI